TRHVCHATRVYLHRLATRRACRVTRHVCHATRVYLHRRPVVLAYKPNNRRVLSRTRGWNSIPSFRTMQPKRRVKIGIVELGRVGMLALRSLLELGWRDFVLGDARVASLSDKIGELPHGRRDLGRQRVDAAIDGLRLQFPDSQFELQAGPEAGPLWSGGWLEHCTVCLLACDAASEFVTFEANNNCLSARVPLIPGLAMGSVGQVGPVVQLGEGPCLRCIDLRIRAAT